MTNITKTSIQIKEDARQCIVQVREFKSQIEWFTSMIKQYYKTLNKKRGLSDEDKARQKNYVRQLFGGKSRG